MKYNPKLCDTNLLPEHEQDDMSKQWQESVQIKKLIDRYAHDYRDVPMCEDDLRVMFMAYTEEYEESKDDASVGDTFEHPYKEWIAIGVVLVVVFFIGVGIGAWVG